MIKKEQEKKITNKFNGKKIKSNKIETKKKQGKNNNKQEKKKEFKMNMFIK